MTWPGLETPMVGANEKLVTFWRSRLLENAFHQQFHDNKCLWDLIVLYYFGYEVILFQIFFKYQNPESTLSYVKNPEFQINPEIFYPWNTLILYYKTCLHDIYLFKVNNRITRTWCEICSRLTIKTPEQPHLHCSGVFIVNFEHISNLFLVFLLLILNK